LSELDSFDLVEGLILFLYDWFLCDVNHDDIDQMIYNYCRSKDMKEEMKNQSLNDRFDWISSNINEINIQIYSPSEERELALQYLEEIILEYIKWRSVGRDFSKVWILIRQKYNYMYNATYEEGKYEIRKWDLAKKDGYNLGELIEILD
jgi:hypothetical protein